MLIVPDWLRYSLEWSVIGLPLGIYLLGMGTWQYRLAYPVLVSGQRDLSTLLIGLSGFFLLGPPTWLVHRLRWHGDLWYWLGYAGYVVMLLLLAWWLLCKQARTTIIYAVDAADVREVLVEATHQLSASATIVPDCVYWPEQQALLQIRISPWLRTATLRWLEGSEDWRQSVEQTIQAALTSREAARGPVPVLLLGGTILIGLATFHLLIWLLLRWLKP
jgi:hypothetical protein